MNKKTAQKKKKIFIVDANPIVRFGIDQLLQSQTDLVICGEADTNGATLQSILEVCPDLVIAQATFRRADGLELVKNLRKHSPQLPVIITGHQHELVYADRALRAGARGYLEMNESVANILKAIRCVLKGEIYLNDQLRGQMLSPLVKGGKLDNSPVGRLTDRELEVFRLLGRGCTARQIAQEMFLSVSTVETHRTNIKDKLGANTTGEVMRHAFHWSVLQQLAP